VYHLHPSALSCTKSGRRTASLRIFWPVETAARIRRYDHTVRFWEMNSGLCVRTLQYPDSVATLSDPRAHDVLPQHFTTLKRPNTSAANKLAPRLARQTVACSRRAPARATFQERRAIQRAHTPAGGTHRQRHIAAVPERQPGPLPAPRPVLNPAHRLSTLPPGRLSSRRRRTTRCATHPQTSVRSNRLAPAHACRAGSPRPRAPRAGPHRAAARDQVKAWDLRRSNRPVIDLAHRSPINAVACHPTAPMLVAGDQAHSRSAAAARCAARAARRAAGLPARGPHAGGQRARVGRPELQVSARDGRIAPTRRAGGGGGRRRWRRRRRYPKGRSGFARSQWRRTPRCGCAQN
jgi:hypothetical protein